MEQAMEQVGANGIQVLEFLKRLKENGEVVFLYESGESAVGYGLSKVSQQLADHLAMFLPQEQLILFGLQFDRAEGEKDTRRSMCLVLQRYIAFTDLKLKPGGTMVPDLEANTSLFPLCSLQSITGKFFYSLTPGAHAVIKLGAESVTVPMQDKLALPREPGPAPTRQLTARQIQYFVKTVVACHAGITKN